jgi:hypothetical protein
MRRRVFPVRTQWPATGTFDGLKSRIFGMLPDDHRPGEWNLLKTSFHGNKELAANGVPETDVIETPSRNFPITQFLKVT